ncbi:hypothetical protein CPARA_2gp233 (nucleomorph) [Cryptomonas paramecium]|uniref:Uncharacterized protein n=1 Tax=Cryptomonas paramaecium TaxID=2898 RepID=F2HHU5_9CRYP|nr:hypothetical protein CPARA_2gp233 [Cryptomonas paramecium]AEA38891.1 hypothetical protein CPARA_2gp233 [Cryptomonas paramecium]|mmetsp:Transcript_37052/g.98564  ORF Transcript_37052/g.98564 Transcript_37052/m.98564 type:complete len:93 (+) Transcript_37052:22737-23015(+)
MFDPNILSKKKLLFFIKSYFPRFSLDLRSEQFINMKAIDLLNKLCKKICMYIIHRKGRVFQSDDIRFFFLQNKKNLIFPKLNLLSKKKLKKN